MDKQHPLPNGNKRKSRLRIFFSGLLSFALTFSVFSPRIKSIEELPAPVLTDELGSNNNPNTITPSEDLATQKLVDDIGMRKKQVGALALEFEDYLNGVQKANDSCTDLYTKIHDQYEFILKCANEAKDARNFCEYSKNQTQEALAELIANDDTISAKKAFDAVGCNGQAKLDSLGLNPNTTMAQYVIASENNKFNTVTSHFNTAQNLANDATILYNKTAKCVLALRTDVKKVQSNYGIFCNYLDQISELSSRAQIIASNINKPSPFNIGYKLRPIDDLEDTLHKQIKSLNREVKVLSKSAHTVFNTSRQLGTNYNTSQHKLSIIYPHICGLSSNAKSANDNAQNANTGHPVVWNNCPDTLYCDEALPDGPSNFMTGYHIIHWYVKHTPAKDANGMYSGDNVRWISG